MTDLRVIIAQIMTKIAIDNQSSNEHCLIPNMEGFLLDPLKTFNKIRSKKMKKLIPYFIHYLCPFSNSIILFSFSMLAYFTSSGSVSFFSILTYEEMEDWLAEFVVFYNVDYTTSYTDGFVALFKSSDLGDS